MTSTATKTLSAGKEQILVVEDEMLIADDLARTLTRLGYGVPAVVAAGGEAIDACAEHRPTLILMDIKLRGTMDGIEAAKAIRRRWGTAIVFLTSHSDDATLARASEARPYGYVVKPCVERDLRVAIEVAIHTQRVERELVRREAWFSATLRAIGEGVLATDENGRVTFMNATAERITGCNTDAAVDRPADDVLRLVDRAGARLDNPALVALAKNARVELPLGTEMVRKSGERVEIDDSASPILDDDGQAMGAVIVFRDVTERRALEARLAQAERLASLGSMAAGICHEINNPLAAVVGNVTFSREQLEQVLGGTSPELDRLRAAHEALLDAEEGVERASSVVRDLRFFARSADKNVATVALTDAIASALRLVAHVMRHHATVTVRDGSAPPVSANLGQLTQVFTNLLINAAHAIPDGEVHKHTIVVTTGSDARGHAFAEVQDDGRGIPADIAHRIFEPFFSTKTQGEGMGLGLAICQNIVQSFGGDITVQSTPGRGSTFRITLPPAPSQLEPAKIAPPATAVPTRARVLVIDDDISVLRSLERALRAGHDVTVATTGADALAMIRAGQRFDTVLCDLMMPEMSGIDAFAALRQLDPAQAKRVVFTTGGAFTDRVRDFISREAQPVLSKPFKLVDLLALVAKVAAPPLA